MNPLFAVRERLQHRHSTTVERLAAELELPRAVVEDVLEHFHRRGQVARVASGMGAGCNARGCGSCRLCPATGTAAARYRWLGPPRREPPPAAAAT